MKWKLLFIVWMFSIFTTQAQNLNWKGIDFIEPFDIKNISIDSLGFLWLLTGDQFYKFDGVKTYPKFSSDSTMGDFTSVTNAQNGSWILGTNQGKLINYNPYNDGYSTHDVINKNLPISYIKCPDLENNCIAISYGYGVGIKKDQEFIWIEEKDGLISNETYAALHTNQYYIIASDQGIQKIQMSSDKLDFVSFEFDLLDVITTNLCKQGNNLWVSYFSNGVSKIENEKIIHFENSDLGKINKIYQKDQTLYVASENGLFLLNDNIWTRKYPIEERAEVTDFTFDREGNIWILNSNGELLHASLLFQKFNFKIPQIQAVKYVEDKIWLGNNNGLYILKDNQKTKILNENITCISYGMDLVWVGTYSNGLFVFNNKGELLEKLNSWANYDNQSVLSIYNSGNEVYISSLTGLINFSIENKSGKIKFSAFKYLNEIIGEGYFYQVFKDNDVLYIASDREGLKVLDSDTLKIIDRFDDGSELESIFSMEMDDFGTLWFSSSSSGLGYLENGIAYKRSQEKNSSDKYTSLKKIESGEILMVRSESIDIMDPKTNNIVYHEGEIDFSEEAPFLNSIDAIGNRAIISHGNTIYEYNQLSNLKTKPQVQLDEIIVNLDPIKEKTVFKQEENNFQFNVSASWLTDPNRIVFQYKLEGFDPTWRYTSDRTISYPKLPPGKFNLLVVGSENGEFDNDHSLEFGFRIKRYFYNSWWFWVLIIVVFSFAINKWRDERRKVLLKQSQIEKKHVESQLANLKSQLNPHFLFNAFNTLMGLIEEDQDRSLHFVEKLTDFYRLVLEHGKNELIPLSDEIKLVRIFIDILNERFDNALDVQISKFENSILIPPLTIQLLIENAVKHNELGQKEKLNISILSEKEYIVVKNNLIPKMYHPKSTGSGLQNIKKRYLLLNPKRIQIEKTNSHFIVKLPEIHSSKN